MEITKNLQDNLRAIRNKHQKVIIFGGVDALSFAKRMATAMVEAGSDGKIVLMLDSPGGSIGGSQNHITQKTAACGFTQELAIPYKPFELRNLMEEPLIENPYNKHHVKSFGERKLGVKKFKP